VTDSLPTGERALGLLSVVTPVLDEQDVLHEFHRRLGAALDGIDFELIVVNDGSTDATPLILNDLAAEDPRVRVIHLSRSFGHQTALTAGLDHAVGDATVMIDGDLQDPPEVIPELIESWRQGNDVVMAVREARPGEARWRLRAIAAFYRIFGRLSQISYSANSGDFRLLDRRALDALLAMPERNRFLRGMTSWIGFRQTEVLYDRDERFAGETKYPLIKLVQLALDAIASFSHVPLQMATLLGFLVSGLAFLAIPFAIVMRIYGLYVPGIASVIIVVSLLGGIQLVTLGVIGEYIGRIYDEAKRRPLYVVSSRVNLDPPRELHDIERESVTR
jgi:dolichol-phosphate mannosyltransferase